MYIVHHQRSQFVFTSMNTLWAFLSMLGTLETVSIIITIIIKLLLLLSIRTLMAHVAIL